MSDLCFTPATSLARMLRARKVSAVEVTKAFIAQIERHNPKLNAIVTFLPDQALAAAKALDRRKASTLFGGLPIAYKDNVQTKGIRTTFGSPIYRDHVPAEDHLIVERLSAAGAITLGKTNLPEFAAGSQTFNSIFGATKNPYDPSKTCGGSSGGGAVAVACGMLPFADGGDLAASLRNPPATAMWSASGRRRAACRHGLRRTPGIPSACSGRWRARWAIRPSCSPPWRGRIHARRSRSSSPDPSSA